MWVTLVIAAIIAAGIGWVIWRWWRGRIFDRASDKAQKVFPVWAAQGPFESGAESAAAMRNAHLAVFGGDSAEEMAAGIEGHATSYDADPKTWEEIRRQVHEGAGSDALLLSEGIAAAEGLNKGFMEDGGHRLEFTRQSDGTMALAYKQIWSDDEIEAKKKRNNEALILGVSEPLLKNADSSNEARELVEFLSDLYRAEINEEPDAHALGKVWWALYGASIEKDEPEPEPEIDPENLQTFRRLNEAYLATSPSDSE